MNTAVPPSPGRDGEGGRPTFRGRPAAGMHRNVRGGRVVPRQGVMRSRSQVRMPLSAVAASAVGWPVKPWGDSG